MIKLVILKTVKKRIVLHLKAMLVFHPEIKQRGTEKRFHGYGYILKKKDLLTENETTATTTTDSAANTSQTEIVEIDTETIPIPEIARY